MGEPIPAAHTGTAPSACRLTPASRTPRGMVGWALAAERSRRTACPARGLRATRPCSEAATLGVLVGSSYGGRAGAPPPGASPALAVALERGAQYVTRGRPPGASVVSAAPGAAARQAALDSPRRVGPRPGPCAG
jgi:hypothetical protein